MIAPIPKGEIFTLSEGEHSSYGMIALCRAKVEIDIEGLTAEYLRLNPEQANEYSLDVYRLAKWLIVDKGIAEELPYREFYLGSYWTLKPENRDGKTLED